MHSHTFWICTWIILLHMWSSASADNSPPVLRLDRNWLIESDELPGAVVVKVRAQDDEGDPLVFGLEAVDPSSGPLPFRIDNATGVVYINESLRGRGGESMYLYVTVTDGKYDTKSTVMVTIAGGKDDRAATAGSSGGNATRQGSRPGQQLRPPIFLQPSFGHTERVPQPPTTVAGPGPAAPGAATPPPTTAAPGSTTTAASPGTSAAPPPPPPPPGTASTVAPAAGKERDLAITVVPISVVSCLVIAGVLLAVLFRKRLFRTRSKSATKHDLRKASNSGVVATAGEPMALQHWCGPRAHSNRYEAWDGDNPPGQQAAGSQAPPGKLTDRWEFPRHRLKVFNILGEGCFGQVWRCEAQDIDGRSGTTVVAVKTLKENASEKERADLIQELQVMKMLEPHPNVVRLLGCCTEKDPVFLIMEYVSRGKLQSYLRNSRAERYYGNLHGASNSLTSRDLTTFVYQVARGMEFLSTKGIIHRDLAARNVLVDDGHVCKVADFGFARDIIASHVYERKSEGRLPIRWMAPESLYDNVFSVKSDVWSFGVLMWEVVTLGSTPYPGLAAADVMRKVRDGYRLDKPEHCRRELYNIMYYCWDSDPKDRPTFQELVQLLEALLLSETEYIELERFPDHSYYNMVSLSDEKL